MRGEVADLDQSPVQQSPSDKDDRAADNPWGALPMRRKLRGGRRDEDRRLVVSPRDGIDPNSVDDDGEDGPVAGQDEGTPAAGSDG
jgi:hypothetical protein